MKNLFLMAALVLGTLGMSGSAFAQSHAGIIPYSAAIVDGAGAIGKDSNGSYYVVGSDGTTETICNSQEDAEYKASIIVGHKVELAPKVWFNGNGNAAEDFNFKQGSLKSVHGQP